MTLAIDSRKRKPGGEARSAEMRPLLRSWLNVRAYSRVAAIGSVQR